MKDAMATCHQSLIWIPTNAQGEIIGLKGVQTRTTKEATYEHLDLTHVNFKAHTLKQWEAIHANLAKVFYYDPPLKDRTLENYVKEHVSFIRNAWKKVWLAKGNVGCPNKFLIHVWEALVQYWKTPNVQRESERMWGIRGHVWNPHTHGPQTLYHATQLKINRRSCLGVMHQLDQGVCFLLAKVDACVCVLLKLTQENVSCRFQMKEELLGKPYPPIGHKNM